MYIGSTIDFIARKKYHLWQLKNNKHHSRHLQRTWNKYGENAFLIEIIKTVDIKNMINNEQNLIDAKGYYNVCTKAELPLYMGKAIVLYDKNVKHIGDFESIQEANRKLNTKMYGRGIYPYYSKGYYIFKKNENYEFIKNHINKRYDKWHQKKKVYQFDIDGNLIKEWYDLRDASMFYSDKKLNNNILASIRRNGTAYGFIWSFTKKISKQKDNRTYGNNIKIFLNNKFIKECKSINAAAKFTGKHKQTISRNYKNKTKTIDNYEFK